MVLVHRPERVLILNGSYQEQPLIRAAKSMDLEVVTTGLSPNGIGHELADRYVPRDFSDVDAVLDLARVLEVSGIVAGCNDFAAITAAQVSRELGLPGHDGPETAFAIHHKDLFRAMMETTGLPAIRCQSVGNLDEARSAFRALGTPVLVKPVDLTGGKGISLCINEADLDQAVPLAFSKTRREHVVVEQFVDGTHHGFSCFIEGQSVEWWFVDDEQYFINPFLVAGTSTPTSLSQSEIRNLCMSAERIARAFGLADGLLHLQVVRVPDQLFVLEACRRSPGDLYPEFVSLATGWDYARAIVQSELGLNVTFPDNHELDPVVRQCVMASGNGEFRGVEIAEDTRARICANFPVINSGTEVHDFLTQKCEILLFNFPTNEEMRQHLLVRDRVVRAIVNEA